MSRIQCKGCDSKPSEHDSLEGYCMTCAAKRIKQFDQAIAQLEQPEPKCKTCNDTKVIKYTIDAYGDDNFPMYKPCPDCPKPEQQKKPEPKQPSPSEFTGMIRLNMSNWEAVLAKIDDCRIRDIINWLREACDKLDEQAAEIEGLKTFICQELESMRGLVSEFEHNKTMKPFAQVLKGRVIRYREILKGE